MEQHNESGDLRVLEQNPDEGREAVDRVKNGSKSEVDLADATAWFLSDEDAEVRATKTFEINVSADPDNDKYVRWTVQAISRERIRQFRKQSRVSARRGMMEEIDETKVSLLIATEGTIDPDLRAIAAQVGTTPTEALRRRFAHKPGLIDQIAAEVQGASGYDDDDVRDVAAGKL